MFPQKGLTLLFLVCGSGLLFGQGTRLHFRNISGRDGLSQSTVRSVTSDRQGFMWFATEGGLNRYDGYGFEVFQKSDTDPDSPGSNLIRNLFTDHLGQLWVGHTNGVDLFQPETRSFRHYRYVVGAEGGLGAGFGNVLTEGPAGVIWVGLLPDGLSRIDTQTGEIRNYSYQPQLDRFDEGGVTGLLWDKKGFLWIGTAQGGIYRWFPESDRVEPFEIEFLGRHGISGIFADHSDHLWFATRGTGLVELRPDGSIIHYNEENGFPTNALLSIYEDQDFNLWAGTTDRGLILRRAGTLEFSQYSNDPLDSNSLGNNKVFDISQGPGGLLWFGHNNGASSLSLNSMNMTHYQNSPEENSLSHNRVKSFLEDQKGNLWVGTYGGGLNRLSADRRSWTNYKYDPDDPSSLPGNNIFAMLEDSEGRLWLGTFGAGLALFDPKTGKSMSFRHPNTQAENKEYLTFIFNMAFDDAGRIWFSSWEGLHAFDPETRQFLTSGIGVDLPEFKTFRSLFWEKEEGVFWAGSFTGDLYRYQPSSNLIEPVLFENQQHLAGNEIMCITRTSNGRLWLGVKGSGLNLFEPSRGIIRQISESEGLPDNTVYGILEDQKGLLWLSTNNGICAYNTKTLKYRNFRVEDGIQGREFNAGAWLKLRSGELAFGGTNGFNLFDPNKIRQRDTQPNLLLTRFKIHHKEVDLPLHISLIESLELNPADNVITFEFAALDFSNPDQNHYFCRLDGFDHDWQQIGSQNNITYTNLDFGRYQLNIKGSGNGSNWESETRSLNILIKPPFYRSKWFYGFMALCLLGLLFFWDWNHKRGQLRLRVMVEERTRSLQKTNQQLEETATNLRNTQKQLLESAHRAGMAEIATDVLHNMGNGLNGVLVSANLIGDHVDALEVSFLHKAAEMLRTHRHQLGPFLEEGNRGERLAQGLELLGRRIETNRDLTQKEIRCLHEQVFKLTALISSQRRYALNEPFQEKLDVRVLLEDVLQIQSAIIRELNISLEINFSEVPLIDAPKTRLVHIFNQVVRNACEALQFGRERDQRRLLIRVKKGNNNDVVVLIKDNGVGINPQDLDRIFSQGFSTKDSHLGTGLHYCANGLKELGGSIQARSEGGGQGATFLIRLPLSGPARTFAEKSRAQSLPLPR